MLPLLRQMLHPPAFPDEHVLGVGNRSPAPLQILLELLYSELEGDPHPRWRPARTFIA
ncbi:hypothetical protein [Streptomyces sioyaensis]|uniref:hypothetical protein n=1 Tax=Streptomyces sioyaensis TaxID=67364 RepID=UPI0037A649BA